MLEATGPPSCLFRTAEAEVKVRACSPNRTGAIMSAMWVVASVVWIVGLKEAYACTKHFDSYRSYRFKNPAETPRHKTLGC
jgi:hypothetical protein